VQATLTVAAAIHDTATHHSAKKRLRHDEQPVTHADIFNLLNIIARGR